MKATTTKIWYYRIGHVSEQKSELNIRLRIEHALSEKQKEAKISWQPQLVTTFFSVVVIRIILLHHAQKNETLSNMIVIFQEAI